MVQFDGGPMEISVLEQMMHTDADLQNAFIQVADLTGRRSPQQFEGFVLLEELAGVELVDRFLEFWRCWRGARRLQVGAI